MDWSFLHEPPWNVVLFVIAGQFGIWLFAAKGKPKDKD